MKKILIIGSIHNHGIDLLKGNKNFEFEVVDNTDTEFLKDKIKDCDGISIRTSKLSKEIIDSAKNLKVISRHGVGYDNIDLKATKQNNITLAITATANAQAVAEHVLFMLFSIAKRNNMYNETVKTGKFSDRTKLPKTIELWNKNILIAGFGRIGKCLLKKCKGLEMNIFVYDPFVSEEEIKKVGGTKIKNLNESLNKMDAISIHMPLNENTKHLINYDMVIEKNITLESHCEHHMAPIIGVAHVSYIPNKKVVGLSKLARTVEIFSKRLQTQERLTMQIAKTLMSALDAKGVAVTIDAAHQCMTMRGIKKEKATTVTNYFLGSFKEDLSIQNRYLKYIGK